MIQIEYSQELATVLDALGIAWSFNGPGALGRDGTSNFIAVYIDDTCDTLLEQVIGQLSALRWRYQPGRIIQLRLP